MGKFMKGLWNFLRLPVSLLLMLFGVSLLFYSTPPPGMDSSTKNWIAIFMIGLGATLYKIQGIRDRETIRARAWRDVMRE